MAWQFSTDGSIACVELVLTWLAQSTLLLVLGLTAGQVLRKAGAAAQSSGYRTTLAAVLFCPLAAMMLDAAGCHGIIIRLPNETLARTLPTDQDLRVQPPLTVTGPRELPSDRPSDGSIGGLGRAEHFAVRDDPPNASSLTSLRSGARELLTRTSRPANAHAADRAWRFSLLGKIATLAVALWVAGAIVLSLRLFLGCHRMRRLRDSAVQAEPDVQVLCGELARPMRVNAPVVLRTPFLSSPCVDGLWRPAILLPEDVAENLGETLVHELAHLLRGDCVWNLLRHAAVAVLWWQPLCWVLSRRIELTAEEVCDDYVVAFGADRARYAGHLLEVAKRTLPLFAPGAVAMISLRSLLARRVSRILDSSRGLSTRVSARIIATTLLAGLAAVMLAALIGVSGTNRSVLADRSKRDETAPANFAPTGSPQTRAEGRVVDPDGKPVVGATVTVARFRAGGIGPYGWDADRQEMDKTVSGNDGRFSLTYENLDVETAEKPESPDHWRSSLVVAQAPGFGPAWVAAGDSPISQDKPLSLARDDVPISGRIVDLEGRPVAGVEIKVDTLWDTQGADAIDRWRREVAQNVPRGDRPRSHYFPIHSKLPGNEPAISISAITDGDGRFRLAGLGRDRLAVLTLSGPSITFQRVEVVTRVMDPVAGRHLDEPGVDDPTYYGANATIVVAPGRPIEGIVRDVDTKAPIPGAVVTAQQKSGSTLSIEGLISAVTDSQGRYRLIGLPKSSGHKLAVYPPLDQPYFITDFLSVPAGPGLGSVPFDIELKRGLWITGRVTGSTTGQPVQAALHYYPFLSNEHARAFPNFRADTVSFHWTGSRYRTGADGRFRLVGLPGRGIVAAKCFDRSFRLGAVANSLSEKPSRQTMRSEALATYNQISPNEFNALAEINPPASASTLKHDFVLEPSPTMTIHLVDPDGRPLAGANAWGRFPANLDHGDPKVHGQGTTKIYGLDKRAQRVVVFTQPERRLGMVLVLRPGEAADGAERTVTLRPSMTVTGRVLDHDGKPVEGGVTIRLAGLGDEPASQIRLPSIAFDRDGRFRIENLAPGASYSLRATNRLYLSTRMQPERFPAFELATALAAEPGGSIDLGTFNGETGQRVDAKASQKNTAAESGKQLSKKIPIAGRVVDLEGRPVAGVKVGLKDIAPAKNNDLTKWLEAVGLGEPPWTAYEHLQADANDPDENRPVAATTDADGRFRIDSIGPEKVVTLTIQGPTIAFTTIQVVTRKIEPLAAKGFASWYGPGTQTIYGSEFVFTANPSRIVEGIVRDVKTKQPLAGAEVRSTSFAGSTYVGIKDLSAKTDAQGRFRLTGLPKGKGNRILVVPNDEQPYFMKRVDIPDPAGIAAVSVEIGLDRGIWITGKVAEKATSKPVVDAWMHYWPFLDNKFAPGTAVFHNDGNVDGVEYQDRYVTKADGTYRLVGLPGHAIVGAYASKGSYLTGAGSESIKGINKHGYFDTYRNPVWPGRLSTTSMKGIDPSESVQELRVDLDVLTGASVRVQVVDQHGKPVKRADVRGRTGRGSWERDPMTEDSFEVVNLFPREERAALIWQKERRLGKAIMLKEGETSKAAVVITLEPLATIVGRALDADGNPVSGATIRNGPQPSGDFSLNLDPATTDKSGRFRIPDLPTGCDYWGVVESRPQGTNQNPVAFFRDVKVRPGETTDIGDIRFKKE